MSHKLYCNMVKGIKKLRGVVEWILLLLAFAVILAILGITVLAAYCLMFKL